MICKEGEYFFCFSSVKQTYNIIKRKRTIGTVSFANLFTLSQTDRINFIVNKVIDTHNALQCCSGNSLQCNADSFYITQSNPQNTEVVYDRLFFELLRCAPLQTVFIKETLLVAHISICCSVFYVPHFKPPKEPHTRVDKIKKKQK